MLDDQQQRHTLLRACFRSYFASFVSAVLPRLCLTAFTFSQPFLINATLNFVSQPDPDSAYGKGLIGAWALIYLGIAVSRRSKQLQSWEACVPFNTEL